MEKTDKPAIIAPWSMSYQDTLSQLDSDEEQGLSSSEAQSRLEKYGSNKLREHKKKNAWIILVNQFKSLVMLLLAIAAGLSFAFHEYVDGIAILAAILINAFIGFFTELKAVRSMESLQELNAVTCRVLRDDEIKQINAEELVPGDIVVVESGEMIPADARLIENSQIRANESILTGESVPVNKSLDPVEKDTGDADRINMLYKGTTLSRGSGAAIVTATGMHTEVGTISELIEDSGEKEDPLKSKIDVVGRQLVIVSLITAVLAGGSGLLTGKELFLMIETIIVLVVAAIPEGLPIVATSALARGMRRMAAKNALVRRLSAVQTLGSTNVIFTDKTGTLTENEMTVVQVEIPGKSIRVSGKGLENSGDFLEDEQPLSVADSPLLKRAVRNAVLCNNASFIQSKHKNDHSATGDPMEVALLVMGAKAQMDRAELTDAQPEEKEYAFDPDLKMMATAHQNDDGYYYAVKGAPSSVIRHATHIEDENGIREWPENEKEEWLKKNDALAQEGLRVLATAYKQSDQLLDNPYDQIIFNSLLGLEDPPREDVKSAIEKCKLAGIRVIMVTGDHSVTAESIGRAVGILDDNDEKTRVLEGSALAEPESLSEEERERILNAQIFYRVSPEQKLNLIAIYQESDSIVGMTGDGVNDGPALKKADIGISMGQRGQQVAKDASDMILQDDSFPTIVHAIQHGRTIFHNLRKFIIYLISGNLGQILLVTIASLALLPLPVLPLQILFLNVINDVFPAMALGMGEDDPEYMRRPPLPSDEPLLNKQKWIEISIFGVLISVSVLAVFAYALKGLGMSETQAVTVSFSSLAFARLFHMFNMRENGSRFIRNQVFRNKWVWASLVFSGAQILLVLFIPFLRDLFSITTISLQGWGLIAAAGLFPTVVTQIWRSLAKADRA